MGLNGNDREGLVGAWLRPPLAPTSVEPQARCDCSRRHVYVRLTPTMASCGAADPCVPWAARSQPGGGQGCLAGLPGVYVDCFPPGAAVYFLSHAHTDHTQGLPSIAASARVSVGMALVDPRVCQ